MKKKQKKLLKNSLKLKQFNGVPSEKSRGPQEKCQTAFLHPSDVQTSTTPLTNDITVRGRCLQIVVMFHEPLVLCFHKWIFFN